MSPLGAARGSSNALTLRTDLMGELTILETDPGIEQTAYALVSDLLRIHQEARR
jgi:homoserine dehydrogenase